jgi:hypothetical protein
VTRRNAKTVGLAIALVVLVPAVAPTEAATAAAGLSLEMRGACPDEAAVRRLLAELVSADQARGVPISIWDQGPHYRIAVRGVATTLNDPARDCAVRAREAAVVAARDLLTHPLVLGPPTWTVEKGLVIESAPDSATTSLAYGAEMRAAYGSGPWSLFGAVGGRGPVTLALEQGWQADLLRFPLDAGARLTLYRWRLRPWFAVGGSATVTGILGRDLVSTDREWRVDPGAIAMVGATLPLLKRAGAAAALAVRWQRAHRLQVVPVGTVGETPDWWLGLSLNYTIDGKPSSP